MASKRIVPSIRAAIVILLLQRGYTPYQISKILDLTPSAISQYMSKKRGKKLLDIILSDPEISSKLSHVVTLMEKEGTDPEKSREIAASICSICEQVRNKYGELLRGFPY